MTWYMFFASKSNLLDAPDVKGKKKKKKKKSWFIELQIKQKKFGMQLYTDKI